MMVPRGGLEPPRLAAPDFESGTSTNSITEAGVCSGNSAYFATLLLLRHESVTKNGQIPPTLGLEPLKMRSSSQII